MGKRSSCSVQPETSCNFPIRFSIENSHILYFYSPTLLKGMHQYVVGNVPDEGEKRVVLFVVHRILDLRVIKRQFGLHLYEAVLKPQRSKPLRF